ncbi:MAG TPA: hypothetical protein VFR03_10590 [Thermoanaerobaculia bacterium]|nr:hypothetical protein [Thermoanaerobaculia bacterium]
MSTAGGAQRFPHLAANAMGELVITWVGAHAHDGGYSLYAIRYNANGTPATDQIVVSDQAQNVAANSAVAIMDDGSFVVLFPKPDVAGPALAARWYTPEGDADGGDVVVTRNFAPDFSLSTRGDGGFVAVWEGSAASVSARVFKPSHSAGSEIVVDPAGIDPVVAVGPKGAFVVAWRKGQILARRFTPQGATAGASFVVDSEVSGAGPGAGNNLRIGKEDDGNFLILWSSGSTVFGRRYSSDTRPLDGLLRMQAGANYDAAIGGQGNFVLVWEAPDPGSQGTNVFARRFKYTGAPLGPQLRVNQHARGSQAAPQVGIGADGGFVVVWQSLPDATPSGIFARRFNRK